MNQREEGTHPGQESREHRAQEHKVLEYAWNETPNPSSEYGHDGPRPTPVSPALSGKAGSLPRFQHNT